MRGAEAALQYVTGYLLEWSLSVDNIFVIAVIFTFMKIPPQYQYRVLFWGIVGAIVLRGAMIAMGAALIHAFELPAEAFGMTAFWLARMTPWPADRPACTRTIAALDEIGALLGERHHQ